eukprot:5886900-Alexandrium_andersonii.AAC.1
MATPPFRPVPRGGAGMALRFQPARPRRCEVAGNAVWVMAVSANMSTWMPRHLASSRRAAPCRLQEAMLQKAAVKGAPLRRA